MRIPRLRQPATGWSSPRTIRQVRRPTPTPTCLGDESDPGDLGIAEMNDEVNHRRFSPEGDPVQTAFHGEPDEVQRLTSSLRTSGEGIWPLIRSLVETEGIRSRDEHWLGPGTGGPNDRNTRRSWPAIDAYPSSSTVRRPSMTR